MGNSQIKLQEGFRVVDGREHCVLGISLIVNDDAPISESIRHINENISEWLQTKKDEICERIFIVYTCESRFDADVISWSNRLFSQRTSVFSRFVEIQRDIVLLNIDGTVRSKLKIEKL